MDGYNIIVHHKNDWVRPGKDGVALNMDRERKAIEWEKMEEIMRAARDRYMDSDVPFYTVMAETIMQINETRESLIRMEQEAIPMEQEILEDKKRRRDADEKMIAEMNL